MKRGEIYYYLRSRLERDHQRLLSLVKAGSGGRERVLYGAAQVTLSNICIRNCVHCVYRADQFGGRRFRLSRSEILAAVELAAAAGFRWLILKSGDDPGFTPPLIAELIRELKNRFDLHLTLSLGERPAEVYELWRRAGGGSYWLRHETCDQHIYRRVRPSMFWVDRMEAFSALHKVGYLLGSGVMIGLPNQSWESLVEDLLFFQQQNLAGAVFEPFLPPPDSPGALLVQKPENLIISPDLVTLEKVTALARLLRPETIIILTNLFPPGEEKNAPQRLLAAGANAFLFSLLPLEPSLLDAAAPFSGRPFHDPQEINRFRDWAAGQGFQLRLDPPPPFLSPPEFPTPSLSPASK